MKKIWYREELWDFVKWISREKDDKWILVRKKDGCVTDAGYECYEWATIDCGNEEWLVANKKNNRLFSALNKSQEAVELLKRKIGNKWCGIED